MLYETVWQAFITVWHSTVTVKLKDKNFFLKWNLIYLMKLQDWLLWNYKTGIFSWSKTYFIMSSDFLVSESLKDLLLHKTNFLIYN